MDFNRQGFWISCYFLVLSFYLSFIGDGLNIGKKKKGKISIQVHDFGELWIRQTVCRLVLLKVFLNLSVLSVLSVLFKSLKIFVYLTINY